MHARHSGRSHGFHSISNSSSHRDASSDSSVSGLVPLAVNDLFDMLKKKMRCVQCCVVAVNEGMHACDSGPIIVRMP